MSITHVKGIRVGHAQDPRARTGTTVVLFPGMWETVCDARGGWPGTYDTDSAARGMTYPGKHAIFLSGGDVYGFDAAVGVRRFLLEEGLAKRDEPGAMPSVGGAVIYDLAYADVDGVNYPDLARRACQSATPGIVEEGNVGGGTGATVGKFLGSAKPAKGGLGSQALEAGGITVGAITVCNAVGNVHDPATGEVVASATIRGRPVAMDEALPELLASRGCRSKATTIGVVALDVALPRDQLWRVALVAHDGLALAVRPAHTATDGDTLFAVCPPGGREALSPDELDVVCHLATQTVAQSIVRGVRAAEPHPGGAGTPSGGNGPSPPRA